MAVVEEFPVRFTVMTINLWGDKYWPQRSGSLSQVLSCRPDILFVQELTPVVLQFLEELMVDYDHIVDDNVLGLKTEGNIFWNRKLFSSVETGCCPINMIDYPNRELFWARLKVVGSDKTCFVSTAHLPWMGCNAEIETGINQRILATNTICSHLRNLISFDEAAVFGGDLNEDYHSLRILSDELGLMDVFESLDLPPPTTHPVRPSDPKEEMFPNRTIDWITCALPGNCRVIAAYSKQIRGGRGMPPSDHFPILAVFEIA